MTYQEKHEIKNCFWIFLFLLLSEGIFRRWLFPSLNNLFLVARDPFVLYAVYVGIKAGLLKDKPAIAMFALSFLCFISAMIFGHGNLVVAIYGMRILLYFPFIYIISRVLTRNDVLKVGRVFVLLIVPMTILCMVQFVSPQSSFVNVGVGGDEGGAGFSGALGYFRPPGIFTFIAALTDYYGVSFAFLLYFLVNRIDAKQMLLPEWVLYISVLFYIISIPVSISRTHLVQTLLIIAFYFVVSFHDSKTLQRVVSSALIVIILVVIVVFTVPDLDLFAKVFSARFDDANSTEGGLFASAFERTFGWALRAWTKSPLMGFGDGYFTNVGMKILHGSVENYSGEIAIVVDSTEMEWGRIICEDGIILGSLILLTRFYISFDLLIRSRKSIYNSKDLLPWLLLPVVIYLQLFGQLKTSYHLGFCSLITICCLSVVNLNDKELFLKQVSSDLHNKYKDNENTNISF